MNLAFTLHQRGWEERLLILAVNSFIWRMENGFNMASTLTPARVHSLQAMHSREGQIQWEQNIRANSECTFWNTSDFLLCEVWSQRFESYFCLARAQCQNIQPYSSNSVIIIEHNLLPGNLLLFLWHCSRGENYPLPRIASPPVWVFLKAFPWFQPQIVSQGCQLSHTERFTHAIDAVLMLLGSVSTVHQCDFSSGVHTFPIVFSRSAAFFNFKWIFNMTRE